MGIGTGVFLIAAGAIITWGIEIATSGLNLDALGAVLMLVGLLVLGLSLLTYAGWAPWTTAGGSRRTVVRDRHLIEDDAVVVERRVTRRNRIV